MYSRAVSRYLSIGEVPFLVQRQVTRRAAPTNPDVQHQKNTIIIITAAPRSKSIVSVVVAVLVE
jgi:hypothetical protein